MISVNEAASLIPQSERNAYFPIEIARIERESEVITSFYLRRVDGAPLSAWEPGQFLPIRLTIPGQPAPVLRPYSLSTCSNPDYYRLSIRRINDGLVSRFLHDSGKVGLRIEAMTPRGKFTLDQSSNRTVVMLSGGVGLTPMMAMLEHMAAAGKRTGQFRPAYFIHGAENSRVHAFGERVKELAAEYPGLVVHVCYSAPATSDTIGVTHQTDGWVSIDLLKKVLPFGDYDFYLCGPPPFMTSLYAGLIGLGVRPERIRFESFGPATVLRPEAPAKPVEAAATHGGEARVRFSKSGVDAQWAASKGTLLELAEAAGLTPAFGCRSGICGTCRTRIRAGAVEYLEEPLATRAEEEVLLCCSVPRRAAGHQADSHEPDVILEL